MLSDFKKTIDGGLLKMNLCERCGSTEATVRYTGEVKEETLCLDCFNKIISTDLGVELEEQPLTVSIPDNQGVMRNFNIEKMILPNGIFLEAKEDISYGYTFSVHGELDEDQHLLFQKLIHKVKHRISKQYLNHEVSPITNQEQISMVEHEVVGTIDSDENNEDVPLLIIDGRPYEWNEFGKILTINEGCQFQLKVLDFTEDIE